MNTKTLNIKIRKKLKKKGFTLIELVVTISILAILITIATISYSVHLTGSRDTNRLKQLEAMNAGLQVYGANNPFPTPEDSVEVRISGLVVGYQGYIGKNTLTLIGYNQTGKDPKDQKYFTYYVTNDKKSFQLMAYLEEIDGREVATNNKNINFFSQANAASDSNNYKERFPKVFGNKLGILVEDLTYTPIQEVKTITTNGYLDVATTTNSYISYFSDSDKVTGTGAKLIQPAVAISISSDYKDCKEIYDNNPITRTVDGVYTVKPDGSEVKVFCDMLTNSGANTLILDKNNVTLDNYLVGYWDMGTTVNSGSTVLLKDLSRYGNNGTCYNSYNPIGCGVIDNLGPQFVESNGTTGKAMSFDGVDDWVKINHDPNISYPGEVTIVTKFNLKKICMENFDGDPCIDTILMKGGAFNPGFWILANYNKRYYTEVSTNAGGGYLFGSNQENTIGYNTLVFVKKQTYNKYVINGTFGGELTHSFLALDNTNNMTIGSAMESANRVFDGKIDEVRIYNRALTDSEINILYESNK